MVTKSFLLLLLLSLLFAVCTKRLIKGSLSSLLAVSGKQPECHFSITSNLKMFDLTSTPYAKHYMYMNMKCKFDMGRDYNLGCAFRFWHPVCQFRFFACRSSEAGCGRGWESSCFGSMPTVMSGILCMNLSLLSAFGLLLSRPTVQRSHGSFFFFNIYSHALMFRSDIFFHLFLFVSVICFCSFFFITGCGLKIPAVLYVMTVTGHWGRMSPAPIITFPLTFSNLVIVL